MDLSSLYKLSLLALAGFSLNACATAGPKEGAGTVVGAGLGSVAGGLIGGAAGGSRGVLAGAVIGGVAGGLAGNAIGRDMDEQDRAAWMDAQYDAFDTGQRRKWKGQRTYGVVEPGPIYSDPRGECRRYTQKIYIDGRPRSAEGVACRNPNGGWQIAS